MNDFSFVELSLLALAGIFAGFINVVAGGGSLLTLPLMIFFGLPPAIANGSNRIAIIAQNIFAVSNFKRKGVFVYPFSLYVGLSAVAGSIIGAFLAVDLDDKVFNRILALIMVAVAAVILLKQKPIIEELEQKIVKNQGIGIVAFFFLGIYGGFIHAGIGFLIILVLTRINHFSLLKSNSIKVFVALLFSISSLIVFILNDAINWKVGLSLAVGTSIGGILGSHFSMKKGDKWIKRILILAIIAMAIKLWFFNH
ncbi:sulfite exporter TauE/SafE family protein [Mangrovibacterium sp.]|uniref:sulfite exporter TauE/SafE family protein n=1 Tax=Mangrovibacterium sp. TaxID=1961364 RepID=UPI00356AA2D8